MFEIMQEEKQQIEEMHKIKKDVENQLSVENIRIKKEWQSFADLLLVYKQYVKISCCSSIKIGYETFCTIFAGSNLMLALDHGYDNFYILKKHINKKMFKKEIDYKIIAKIEMWAKINIFIIF